MAQDLYHDPDAGHSRPHLIVDLLDVPAKPNNHQLENQATTVLAWLVDGSPELAREVVQLFLGEAPPDGSIGARTQVSLGKPGGGAVYPDLSICVGGRAMQLLVEVKVGSDFHHIDGLLQQEAYRVLWGSPDALSPSHRAVGTLTRTGGSSRPDADALVARDVSWREVRDVLARLLADDALSPDVRLVAESFRLAIDTRIAPPKPSPEALEAFFARWRPLLTETRKAVVRIQGAQGAKPVRGAEYEGFRVGLGLVAGEQVHVRAYLADAGTRLNLPGAPAALVVAPEHNTDGELIASQAVAAAAVGFDPTKDLEGFRMHRRLFPLEDADPPSWLAR